MINFQLSEITMMCRPRYKVNSIQEACAKCFAVHKLKSFLHWVDFTCCVTAGPVYNHFEQTWARCENQFSPHLIVVRGGIIKVHPVSVFPVFWKKSTCKQFYFKLLLRLLGFRGNHELQTSEVPWPLCSFFV